MLKGISIKTNIF